MNRPILTTPVKPVHFQPQPIFGNIDTSQDSAVSTQTQDVMQPIDTTAIETAALLNATNAQENACPQILSPMAVYQAHLTQRDIKGSQALVRKELIKSLSHENTELTTTYYNLQADNVQREKEQSILNTTVWVSTAGAVVCAVIGFFMARGVLPIAITSNGAQTGFLVASSAFAVGGGAAEIAQANSIYTHGETLGKLTEISYIREKNLTHISQYHTSATKLLDEMAHHFTALKRIIDGEYQTIKQCTQY